MNRHLLCSAFLFGCLATSSYAVITISGNNNATNRLLLTSSTGTPLQDGSAIRVGFFNDPAVNAAILTGTDFTAINALFKPIGEGQAGGGTLSAGVLASATLPLLGTDPLVSGPGRFSFSVGGITQTYAPQNTPIYFWVFNDAVPAQATEWAIFTNDDSANGGTPWLVPFDDPNLGGSTTLAVTTTRVDDVTDVITGSLDGGQLRLEAVPEPSLAALCLTATSLLFRRRRTQG
jgi:hypothetical protein